MSLNTLQAKPQAKQGDHALCRAGNVVYGAWTRSLSPEQKLASLEVSLDGLPDRFWLIFSHIYPDDDQEYLAALSASHQVAQTLFERGAAAYLLERRTAP
jgi:hypothetical protein